MTARSLTELVDEASSWTPVDWWRLELRSFSRTPAQRPLAVLAPAEAMSEHRGVTLGSFIQGLAYLFAVAAPVIAAAAMVRWVLGDTAYDFPLAFAGTVTLVSLLVTGWSELQRLRHPRASRASAVRMLALIHVIPGLITALIALTAGAPFLQGGAWVWIAVVAADIVVHVVILIRGPLPAGGPQNERENLQWSIREIPPGTLAEITARRDAAIRRLADRGLIEPGTATRALTTAPGELALTLAPELQKSDPQRSR
ncbi:hypothetical protein J2X85_002184 [Microbacterium trichothecenolyticum]|uniref:hypothetical protein n=1 Tax=Microbacterium trichothecenolyticum TaxID=69370 RepID=UPI002858B639|nr:hypothetical protein [Microbacterium trichothecenolyticum]MDR7185150.1 hypothetical protein [Microbacterium trichothecenolyticum]